MAKFLDDIQNESKKYGAASSDRFEFKKGVNRIRILVQPKVLATHFFGEGMPSVVCVGIDEGCKYHGEKDKRPSIKLVTYILDRDDANKLKLAELPLSISYGLNDLQDDSDFAFDVFPMPYDVKITHDPDNKDPKAKYRLVASPKREALTEEEQSALTEAMNKMTPEQYVEKRKNKTKEGASQDSMSGPAYQGQHYPEGPNPDDVPF